MERKDAEAAEEVDANEFKSLKNVVRCPTCGCVDVVYTCEPKCCFNHVCVECRASFELITRKIQGESLERREVELPESSEPTVACAACQGLRVYVIRDAILGCGECGAVLELTYESISYD